MQDKNFLALKKIFKVVIISQIAYKASIWYMPNDKKKYYKTLVMQLAQIQVLGACVIIRAFKATFVQELNIEAYFTFIRLELDKKTD